MQYKPYYNKIEGPRIFFYFNEFFHTLEVWRSFTIPGLEWVPQGCATLGRHSCLHRSVVGDNLLDPSNRQLRFKNVLTVFFYESPHSYGRVCEARVTGASTTVFESTHTTCARKQEATLPDTVQNATATPSLIKRVSSSDIGNPDTAKYTRL